MHGGFGAEIAAQVQEAAFDELDAADRAGRRPVRADSVQPRRSKTRTCPHGATWLLPCERRSVADGMGEANAQIV